MRLAILESPYAGDVEENVKYARAKMRELVLMGFAPIASHLLYTQPGILDDSDPQERALGIFAGLEWRMAKSHDEYPLFVFAVGRGWSRGMRDAFELVKAEQREYIVVDSPPATNT